MAKFNTGQSFADGDQVTGAKLNNIVGLLDIYSGVIADQASIAATVSTADLLLIADTDAGSSGAANKVTVQKLLNDTLTGGTFTNANIAEQLTYGTATGNRTISTSATITTGTIPNLTAGTTTSTAATITNGTITTGLIPTLYNWNYNWHSRHLYVWNDCYAKQHYWNDWQSVNHACW
jgi:hypothetical protein